MALTVVGLTVGLLEENCYILGCDVTGLGVVVDPGDNPRAILAEVEKMGLTIEKIINTHAHFDHVMAVDPIRNATGATFHLHRDDLPILRDAPERVSLWLSSHIDPIDEPDDFLEHGQIISFGEEEVEVRLTPGHAPGHVIFVHHAGRLVFGGDTLFQGSIGRFDLPMADGPTLLHSIHTQILTLPDEYTVYPGHGAATSIGHERVHNPFVGSAATTPQ
jgi:hydroxyacylglutathione hydrolase